MPSGRRVVGARGTIISSNQGDGTIVVGIDGSKAAVRAALWAADEAVRHDNTLRLLHVIDVNRDDQEAAMADARRVLNEAWDAVVATGKPVKIESDIAHGDAALRLVEESGLAGMVCVGHKGRHDSGPGRRGSTAVQVARSALCTVAVVRHRKLPSPFHQWIIAVLDESQESRLVLRTALDESALRQGPVLVLTSWSTTRRHGKNANALWQKVDRYLDEAYHGEMQICAIPMPDDIVDFLEQCVSIDQLVIVGARNKALTHELTTARAAKVMRNSNSTLMFVQAGAEGSAAPR